MATVLLTGATGFVGQHLLRPRWTGGPPGNPLAYTAPDAGAVSSQCCSGAGRPKW